MDISSKTVTTKVHTAVASSDDLKGVAIAAVVHQLGLSSDAIVSSSAKVDDDGSITVEVVESVPAEASAPESADAVVTPSAPVPPAAPAVVAPVI